MSKSPFLHRHYLPLKLINRIFVWMIFSFYSHLSCSPSLKSKFWYLKIFYFIVLWVFYLKVLHPLGMNLQLCLRKYRQLLQPFPLTPMRQNKKMPLFPVSRPTLIFTPDPNTFYRIWVGQRKRGRKTSRRSVFLKEIGHGLHNKEWN